MLAAAAVWLASVAALYGPLMLKLGRDWRTDESYSHGFLVLPIALLLVWQQRDRLRNAPIRPSWIGLLVILGSLALFLAGSLAAELFTTRISLIGVIAGTILFSLGWDHLKLVAFPLAFLVFMIPLPAILLDQATQSLQFVASGLGERLLRAADIAVLRDGNVLILSAITLNVTDACSGIRSIVSLLMVSSLMAYLFEPTAVRRAILTAAAVPLAVLLNGLRVAATGIAASRFGPEMATGAVHEISGWAIFALALVCVWMLHWTMRSAWRPQLVEGA